jgi:hypothetical protein
MPRASVVVALVLTCAGTSANLEESFAFSIKPQELSEDDALDRFEIDEWFLPKLNIELPALFDWGAVESAYYAHASDAAGERKVGLC